MLGTRTGPGKAADPVGPRQRVAGGPKRKKKGMQGKGDATEKGVWLEPHDGPKGLGRRGKRGIGRGRGTGERGGRGKGATRARRTKRSPDG